MQEMFEVDNDEDNSAPEPSITTKSDGSNSEVSTPIEEQLIICAAIQYLLTYTVENLIWLVVIKEADCMMFQFTIIGKAINSSCT